jgi:hypothetical protein
VERVEARGRFFGKDGGRIGRGRKDVVGVGWGGVLKLKRAFVGE